MQYEEWVAQRQAADSLVERMVVETESSCSLTSDVGRREIMERYAALPFSPRVWAVYFANTLRLAGVKRIDRRPYATHPTRMALSCYWLASPTVAEDVAVAALLHDYLEESGGITAGSFAQLRRLLPSEPLATLAAVVLSEPEIPYERLGRASELSIIRRVAYVVQALDVLQGGAPESLANAALVDKLDNLHDLGYLDREQDAERRIKKLAQRVAFFSLVLEQLGAFSAAVFRETLRVAIEARTRALGLSQAKDRELAILRDRFASSQTEIRRMTGEYHRRIGI